MNRTDQPRIVVLKWDRLYGDLIRRHIWDVWPNAAVGVFQQGIDALGDIQDATPDLFVTGVSIEDMDGLEHLEPFVEASMPILIVTSRPTTRLFAMLRSVRFDGLFDGSTEGMDQLPVALRHVMERRPYISRSLLPFLREHRSATLEDLTEREQVVLSVIGDGSDNKQASERLGISRYTVLSHRESIMRKLALHHSRELMQYALVHGYVVITAKGIYRPGFQRRLESKSASPGAARRVPIVGPKAAPVCMAAHGTG